MKHLMLIVLILAALLFGSLSLAGAQDNHDNTCADGALNSSCNSDLARLCSVYMEHWQAAGGESSGLTIPDWCNSSAQPAQPTSEDDNACEGGLLDGRCVTDWEWTCGWYLQQWEAASGWKGDYQFPDWCDPASLLPPKPEMPVTAPPVSLTPTVPTLAGCYTNGNYSFYYSGVSGSLILEYSAANCAGYAASQFPTYGVEAPDQNPPWSMCEAIGISNPLMLRPYVGPSNLWFCADTSSASW